MENKNKYSQFTAIVAIAKASFRSITRSPSAVIFSLLFPLIFIIVFGFIGNGGLKVDVGVEKNSDIENPILSAIETKINQLESAPAWKEFVKAMPQTFPPLVDGGSTVVVDKMTIEIGGDSYTVGVGARQMFLKADMERVKTILNTTTIKLQLRKIKFTTD